MPYKFIGAVDYKGDSIEVYLFVNPNMLLLNGVSSYVKDVQL